MTISIYRYTSPSLFLQDAWGERKSRDKSFTIRAWAFELGMCSYGTFHQIILGKRSLPKKYIHAVCKSLNLNIRESLYLEVLVDYSKSQTRESSEYYLNLLQEVSGNSMQTTSYLA